MELPPTGYPHSQVVDVTVVILVVPCRPWGEYPHKNPQELAHLRKPEIETREPMGAWLWKCPQNHRAETTSKRTFVHTGRLDQTSAVMRQRLLSRLRMMQPQIPPHGTLGKNPFGHLLGMKGSKFINHVVWRRPALWCDWPPHTEEKLLTPSGAAI